MRNGMMTGAYIPKEMKAEVEKHGSISETIRAQIITAQSNFPSPAKKRDKVGRSKQAVIGAYIEPEKKEYLIAVANANFRSVSDQIRLWLSELLHGKLCTSCLAHSPQTQQLLPNVNLCETCIVGIQKPFSKELHEDTTQNRTDLGGMPNLSHNVQNQFGKSGTDHHSQN